MENGTEPTSLGHEPQNSAPPLDGALDCSKDKPTSNEMAEPAKSFLSLIDDADSFPHIDIAKTFYSDDLQSSFYQFLLPDDPRPHGFMLPSTVHKMPWSSDFKITHDRPRTVQLLDSSNGADTSGACNSALANVISDAIKSKSFKALERPRNEDFKIIGAKYPVQMNRSAVPLFGVAFRGVHMTMYTRTHDGVMIWVSRRNRHLRTCPNMLDSTVAGGVKADETPLECMVHEADEEASLPEELVRKGVRACGVVTYISSCGENRSGRDGLMVPACLYIFDLEVDKDVIPKPQDDEVEEFYLWDVGKVKEALARAELTSNSAAAMIDFFVRHGIVTEDNEKDYLEIVSRLHRPLPVPTSATAP